MVTMVLIPELGNLLSVLPGREIYPVSNYRIYFSIFSEQNMVSSNLVKICTNLRLLNVPIPAKN